MSETETAIARLAEGKRIYDDANAAVARAGRRAEASVAEAGRDLDSLMEAEAIRKVRAKELTALVDEIAYPSGQADA